MSYILQALAQSERERHQEENPDLSRVFDAETTPQSSPHRRRIITIALIANVILIGGIFMLANNTSNTELASSSAALIADTPPPAPVVTPAPAFETAPAPAPVVAPAPILVPKVTAPPVATKPIPITAPEPTPVPLQPAVPIAHPQTQTVPAAVQNTQSDVPVEAEIPVIEPVTTEEFTSVAQFDASQPTAWITEVDERVHAMQGIDMTIHVYSAQPGERFVFINGKQYREGDTLTANGAELAAITPDGIIVDFGNRRTLLNRVR